MKDLNKIFIIVVIFITSSLYAQTLPEITLNDGTNNLMKFTDEGDFGAILLKNGVPNNPNNKLYNNNGILHFNGSQVANSGGTSNNVLSFAAYQKIDPDYNPGVLSQLKSLEELFDEGNNFNPVSGEFTVPVDGIYHFDFKLGFTPTINPVNGATTSLTAQIDGIVLQDGYELRKKIWTDSNSGESVMYSFNIKLLKDEVITFHFQFPNVSNLDVMNGTSGQATSISGFKIN